MVSACATCQGLQKHLGTNDLSDLDETPATELVKTSLPDLRRSSSSQCRACALLLQGILLHHDRFAGIKEETIRIRAESFGSPGSAGSNEAQDHLSVELRWTASSGDSSDLEADTHEDGYPDLKLEFFTDRGDVSPFSAIGRGRHISDNPLQDAGLVTARSLVQTCVSHHSKCRRSTPATLPKRVLDVLAENGSNDIRLYEPLFNDDEQRYESGEYLTLSHCYGTGANVPRTSRFTLDEYKNNISWTTLPRTFQDAISLTRSLGFRWLWIDSLCIIDEEDRCEQANVLDDIYGNSYLTIAATSAFDSKDGLFPPKTQPFKLQARDSRGSASKIYVREQPSHYSFKAPFGEGAHMNDWELPFNSSREANLETPLLKRAWPYAERMLSPRTLHFTKSEMILECREAYQCECGRIDNMLYDSRATDSIKQEYSRVVLQEKEISADDGQGKDPVHSLEAKFSETSISDGSAEFEQRRDEGLQLWSYIVTEYTSREITYDSDRLLAVVGVANTMRDTLKSGYIAGHWTFSTLSLLWHPNDPDKCRRPKVRSNNIPSWSWASVEGSPIFFDNTTAMDLACKASFPAGRNGTLQWSPISGSALELSAAMATEVEFRVDGTNEFSLAKNGYSVEFTPDTSPPQGDEAISTGEILVCVLVSMTFRSSIIGLVLRRTSSDTETYRRVGRVEVYECQRDDSQEEPEDAEALFEHWYPEIKDMTQLDEGPQRTFTVV